jgi:hypothetical protein
MDDEVIRLITENQHLKIKCSTDNIDNHMNHSSVRPQSSNHRYEKKKKKNNCGSVNRIPTHSLDI